MQVRVKCSCGWEFWAEVSAPGEAVTCPNCGKVMSAGDGGEKAPPQVSSESAWAGAEVESLPPALPQTPAQPAGVGVPDASKASAPPPVQAPPVFRGPVGAGPRKPQGQAVGSMVCGIASMIGCPMCFWPFGIVGVLIGTVAVIMGVVSLIKRRGGKGMAIAGVVTGGIGTLVSLVSLSFFGWMIFSVGQTVSSVPPSPVAIPQAPPLPATGSYRSSPPAQLPAVLAADRLADALAAPLDLPRNPRSARLALQAAVSAYPERDRSTPHLVQCVRGFRESLAHAGRDELTDAGHRKMYRTAVDELAGKLLADYRQAGQLERDAKWEQAAKAYAKMLRVYDLSTSTAAGGNIREHIDWCRWKKARADNPMLDANSSGF